ncbi:MAG: 3-methyl-2-oxobutanoate dehydrogenase subunit VorB [Candidatus Omnitrophota bacterium]
MSQVLMTGNEAIGEAAISAGCKLYAGYPITPQNELPAYMSKRMVEEGRVFIQSESELAAINMVFGASVTGARAMTSSSSPGISLKQEGISYLAGCELPAVIINIMRGGPGLGNIAPAQSDYFQSTRGGGHGDYHTISLAPASVQEAVELTQLAFDLADKYRGPVLVVGDGILGQMMEPVESSKLKAQSPQPYNKDWALTGAKARPSRIIRSLLLRPGALEEFNKKLQKKYREIKENEVRVENILTKDAQLIIVAYGTTSRIAKAAVESLRRKKKKTGMIRLITLWPFPDKAIKAAAKTAKVFLVVEMSEGQMVEDVKLAVEGMRPVHFYGRSGGSVPTPEEIEKEAAKLL